MPTKLDSACCTRLVKVSCQVARWEPPVFTALLLRPGTMVSRVGSVEAAGIQQIRRAGWLSSHRIRNLLGNSAGVFCNGACGPTHERFYTEYGHAMVAADLEMLIADQVLAAEDQSIELLRSY